MIKTLAKSQYKRETILSPVLVSLEVALECLIPLYMMDMLDSIADDNSLKNILTYGGILLAMSVFSLVFGMLAGKCAATASAGFATNLRSDIFDRIQGFSFANIDKFSVSSLVTRLTTDITNIQHPNGVHDAHQDSGARAHHARRVACHGVLHQRSSRRHLPRHHRGARRGAVRHREGVHAHI